MKAITLRFSNTTYRLIQNEAASEGITISDFIREAALTKVIILKARNGDYQLAHNLGLTEAVRAIVQAEDGRRRPKT